MRPQIHALLLAGAKFNFVSLFVLVKRRSQRKTLIYPKYFVIENSIMYINWKRIPLIKLATMVFSFQFSEIYIHKKQQFYTILHFKERIPNCFVWITRNPHPRPSFVMLAQVKIIDENISPNLAILENQSKKILNTSLHVAGGCANVLANFFSKNREFVTKIFLLKDIFHKMAKIFTLKKITIPTSKQSIFNRI